MMEEKKRLVRKFRLPVVVLMITVTAGMVVWSWMQTEEKKGIENIWKMPLKNSDSEISEEAIPAEEAEEEISAESAYWFLPEAKDSLLSEEEKKQLEKNALSAAEQVSGIYQEANFETESIDSSRIREFTGIQRKAVVEALGGLGLVSVEANTNMQNYEALEAFYAGYLEGKDEIITVFEVHRNGVIGAKSFIYRKGRLQTYYVGICWEEGGIPQIEGNLVSDLSEIRLTEKGYFIYANEILIPYAGLRQYYRAKPLSDECRKLTDQYLSGLSYVNYNVLVTNWDSSNVEDILMPCMFEDIYRIYTGENLKVKNWEITAAVYEKIMTTYFPVSVEQLRKNCGYDAEHDSYPYEMASPVPYPPFGEVVDYTENSDGTITLIADGVWPDYDSDRAFTNRIVIRPFEDGTFRYLSNSIQEGELELPPISREKAVPDAMNVNETVHQGH